MDKRLTKYEKTRVISVRAQQISDGAPACIDIGNMSNAIQIAEKEFEMKKTPINIIRKLPNGREYKISIVRDI